MSQKQAKRKRSEEKSQPPEPQYPPWFIDQLNLHIFTAVKKLQTIWPGQMTVEQSQQLSKAMGELGADILAESAKLYNFDALHGTLGPTGES